MATTVGAEAPALRFVEAPLHPNEEDGILLNLREQGYAILGGVFERDSVDAYVAQLTAAIRPTSMWYAPYEVPLDSPLSIAPARAPRLRSILRRCFGPWWRPNIGLQQAGWVVRQHDPDPRVVHDWHKDADHEVLACRDGHYHYPNVIHAVAYFADMSPAHGPTYVIPRSHRDASLSPHGGAREVPFLPGKADVVLWDQRTWHRGSARTIPGYRIAAIFGFYPLPICTDAPLRLPAAQREAARSADPIDQLMFGGPYAADA